MSVLRITDEATAEELAEALGHLSHKAQREMPVVGTVEHPTAWDNRHEALDRLLIDC